MNIRKANLKDIENNLLNLYVEGFKYHYNGRPDVFSDKTEEELKNDLIKEIDNSAILILENEKEIVGYTAYEIKEKHNKTLWISEIVIDKNSRHSGNGKKLIEKLKEIARNEECQRIELCCWAFNQNAFDMYKHIGFNEQRTIMDINV